MGNLVRGHLNLQLSLKVTRTMAPEAHGILGQTMNMNVDMGIDMVEPVCSCPPANLCASCSHGHYTSCPLPACLPRS